MLFSNTKLFISPRRFVALALAALVIGCCSHPLRAQETVLPETLYNAASESYNAGQFDKAIDLYTQAIKGRATFSDAYFNRGLAYEAKSDWKRAAADFTKVITSKPRLADAYLERARCYAGDGNPTAALGDLAKVIEIKPALADTYLVRGDTYYNNKQYASAVADYSKYIGLAKPVDPLAYKKRSESLYQLQKWSEAAEDLKRYQDLVSGK